MFVKGTCWLGFGDVLCPQGAMGLPKTAGPGDEAALESRPMPGESRSANMDGISTAAHRRADRKVRLTIQKASVCTQSPIGGRIRAACPEGRRVPGVGRVAASVRRVERRGDDGRQVDCNGESGGPH
jgi:hypothetical protein